MESKEKEIIYTANGIGNDYIGTFLRSIVEDTIFSAIGHMKLKFNSYKEQMEIDKEGTKSEEEFYTVNGFTLNVPTYTKGDLMNQFLIDKFIKPNERDTKMISNYYFFHETVETIKNNPKILEQFYTIETDSNYSNVNKILKIGRLKSGKYDSKSYEYVYNYSDEGLDSNTGRHLYVPQDRLKSGIMSFKIMQTNVDRKMEHKKADDALLTSDSILICSNGSSPSKLNATALGNWATAGGKTIATVEDDSIENIGNFGHCKSRNKECKYSKSTGWLNSDSMSFAGKDAITDKSYISCANGGTIKVQSSGQDFMKTNTKVRN